jgi:hypothetical protein
MTVKVILEVEQELIRFQKRLDAAKKRISEEGYHRWSGSKETAALKRSALDLKNELTKLNKTQYD